MYNLIYQFDGVIVYRDISMYYMPEIVDNPNHEQLALFAIYGLTQLRAPLGAVDKFTQDSGNIAGLGHCLIWLSSRCGDEINKLTSDEYSWHSINFVVSAFNLWYV